MKTVTNIAVVTQDNRVLECMSPANLFKGPKSPFYCDDFVNAKVAVNTALTAQIRFGFL